MLYDQINSLSDITAMKAAASSEDGETSVLELKGNGTGAFKKDQKNLLSKEICALANTYGGVVIFHGGKGDELKGFLNNFAKGEFTKVESWLASCLETRLSGMRLKIVEGVFVIDVPESQTKPHRTTTSKEYFYRHESTSQPMPEIMISSMYRSQDYLDFVVDGDLSRDNYSVTVGVKITNLSRISGSRPKIQIQIFGQRGLILNFHDRPYFEPAPRDFFGWESLLRQFDVPRIGRCETDMEFAKKTLYPSDQIYIQNNTVRNNLVGGINHILLRTDCMLKEGTRHTDYFVVELRGDGVSLPIISTHSSSAEDVIRRFVELREANVREAPVKFIDP